MYMTTDTDDGQLKNTVSEFLQDNYAFLYWTEGKNNGNPKIQNQEGSSGFSEIHFRLKICRDTRHVTPPAQVT